MRRTQIATAIKDKPAVQYGTVQSDVEGANQRKLINEVVVLRLNCFF
jgi:hypothetical protein